MERRVLLFFLLSFLVIFGMNYFFAPKHPPRPMAPAGARTAQTTQTLGGPTTQTLAQAPAATPQAVSGNAATSQTAPARPRTEAPTVTFRNDEITQVVFSTQGAVPIRWDIIDPKIVPPPAGESRESMIKKGLKSAEALIDPDINKVEELPRPFETILQESGGGAFYNNFNTDLYTTQTVTRGKMKGYRFTSPPSRTGVRMIKTWLFEPGKFTGRLEVELVNEGQFNLTFDREGGAGLGVIMGPGLGKIPEDHSRYLTVDPAVLGPDGMHYAKPGDPGDTKNYPGSEIRWGGIQSLYYLAVLIPEAPTEFSSARVALDRDIGLLTPNKRMFPYYFNVELYSKPFNLKKGERAAFNYEFFIGPKQRSILAAADHELTRAQFFSSWNWMRALSIGMMKGLLWLQRLFVNWGVAIIILTIIVRVLTFPLVQKGMKSQAKMQAEQQKLKPLMDKLNEKYKNDPQRKQQEIFKLYKEHGVNPFGAFKGCIWMMIQMPILVSLYYVINQSIELRGASFLWITDLSQPDRLFRFGSALPLIGRDLNLLPLIMAATQILTGKLTPQTSPGGGDPQQEAMQRNMMIFMPLMMLFIFYGMPSGLVLYWTISNIWQIGQQWFVNKHMPRPGALAAAAPKKA